MPSAIISRREDSDEISACKSLKAIQDALVSPDDLNELVIIEKRLDNIRTKFNDVSSPMRIPDGVHLDPHFIVILGRIRPENIDD